MTTTAAHIAEMKRRARAWISEARESRGFGDRFNVAFCLQAAAECRAKIAAILARRAAAIAIHDEFAASDLAWDAEIRAAFPRGRSGDIRYTDQGKGAPGSLLRFAYDRRCAAASAYAELQAGPAHFRFT